MLFVAILEVVLVSWIYGVDKIFAHIEEMEIKIPTFMKCYWRVCWKYLTPGNTIHAVHVLGQYVLRPLCSGMYTCSASTQCAC